MLQSLLISDSLYCDQLNLFTCSLNESKKTNTNERVYLINWKIHLCVPLGIAFNDINFDIDFDVIYFTSKKISINK